VQPDGERTYRLCVPDAHTHPHLTLQLHLPERYPSLHPPAFQLHCNFLPGDAITALVARLESSFTPGAVVLYEWVECLREGLKALAPTDPRVPDEGGSSAGDAAAADALTQRLESAAVLDHGSRGPGGEPRAEQRAGDSGCSVAITHGAPFIEKKSTFQAHLAAVTSVEEVRRAGAPVVVLGWASGVWCALLLQ
jgi:hypothetical protein